MSNDGHDDCGCALNAAARIFCCCMNVPRIASNLNTAEAERMGTPWPRDRHLEYTEYVVHDTDMVRGNRPLPRVGA